ncbi:uncharacterized protein LOC110449369 [Mizuhopecten yessoensis]|uniref:Long-chain-fatty-acid--CoA ligase FadD13 n=1 Tax=Mizuhopecten yessoensis TaxID=6573 RepID=A0A210QRB8_MIZYE|nr:uncharacterized protein LOC110449369 [Mizuhopecten yessoensis]XP_021351870.1 uncharacterized protein LOC110449369 [Mizuhopecten yessoensis]OWF51263.1 Long-chain-fatty-acid--CoA ligase FadD13 [Mizuhopecten yessoensis]
MADLSYISCPNTAYIRYMSIPDVLQERTNEAPEKEICVQRFVGGGRRSLTYAELLNRSTYIAKYLTARGIVPGDCVAIIGLNSIEWIIGEFAIFLTGAVALQVNKTDESFVETMKLLKSTQSKAVLLDPESDEKYISDLEAYFTIEESPKEKPIVMLLHKSALSSLPSMAEVKLTAEEEVIALPRIQPESSAFIFTTSGSTGVPKMVEMTHLSVVNASYIPFAGTGGDMPYGTCYNDRPFSWSGGTPIYSILNGNKRVFVDTAIGMKKENIMLIWDIIMAEKCTNAVFLPYALVDIIANLDAILKHGYIMYSIITGSQNIGSHLTEMCGKCTKKFFMNYGCTEVGDMCVIELTPKMEEGNVGSLFPGYEVKVIGVNCETLHREQLGEILVRSPWMLKSYRNAPELSTASFVDGGWFRTGDIGIITTDGKLFVKGKSNDVIKRGGLKVLTSVVEAAMYKLPCVREVVVISVPDKRLFEEVCACYILKDYVNASEDELDQKCRAILGDNVLGSTPTYFLRFDAFPRLSNGKTNRTRVKTQALGRLELDLIQ